MGREARPLRSAAVTSGTVPSGPSLRPNDGTTERRGFSALATKYHARRAADVGLPRA